MAKDGLTNLEISMATKKIYDLKTGANFMLPMNGTYALFKGGVLVTDNEETQAGIELWLSQTGQDVIIEDFDPSNPRHGGYNVYDQASKQVAIKGVMTIDSLRGSAPNNVIVDDNQLAKALFDGTAVDLITSSKEELAALGNVPNEALQATEQKASLGKLKK
jgi:hypothetical protein